MDWKKLFKRGKSTPTNLGPTPETVADSDERANQLIAAYKFIAEADKMADGTSNSFKRVWVYNRMRETYPNASGRTLDLLISLALNNVR